MKTKLSILTALLALASAASVQAQTVYSQNIVGYVNQAIPAGFSMVANQLNVTPNNTVTNLFASPPPNTSVYKAKPAGGYDQLTYIDGLGWLGDATDMTMNPGEGVWIYSDVLFTNTFVGEVKLGSTNAIPPGFSIRSSSLPVGGSLGATPLTFPAGNNDAVHVPLASGGYRSDSYIEGLGWLGDSGGSAPSVTVGQAFWVFRDAANGTTNWVQNYSVGP